MVDIAKQAVFLQEVAHPDIGFRFDAESPTISLVCDRRQLGQALTNVVKHAQAERVSVTILGDDQLELVITDDGRGFDRDTAMTSRLKMARSACACTGSRTKWKSAWKTTASACLQSASG